MTRPSPITEAGILLVLDEATTGEWPTFYGRLPHLAYHALRLVVFVRPSGEYVIIFESLVGDDERRLSFLRSFVSPQGNVLADDGSGAEIYLDGSWNSEGENVIVGPAGEVTVTEADLSALEPLRSTVAGERSMLFSLLVRAYLRDVSTDIWPSEARLRSAMAGAFDLDGFEMFLESTAFEHVVGKHWNEIDPDGIDARWRRLPSESETYRSLARALVARDPGLFLAGESNLDWRLHLDAPNPNRRLS